MLLAAMSSATVVIRNGDFLEAAVGEEIVAFSVAKGVCYAFNPVGSRIWQFLSNPTSVSDICNTLVDGYQVDPETCEREALDLLEKLWLEGMIISLSEARG